MARLSCFHWLFRPCNNMSYLLLLNIVLQPVRSPISTKSRPFHLKATSTSMSNTTTSRIVQMHIPSRWEWEFAEISFLSTMSLIHNSSSPPNDSRFPLPKPGKHLAQSAVKSPRFNGIFPIKMGNDFQAFNRHTTFSKLWRFARPHSSCVTITGSRPHPIRQSQHAPS